MKLFIPTWCEVEEEWLHKKSNSNIRQVELSVDARTDGVKAATKDNGDISTVGMIRLRSELVKGNVSDKTLKACFIDIVSQLPLNEFPQDGACKELMNSVKEEEEFIIDATVSSSNINENTYSGGHIDWEAKRELSALNSTVSSEENEDQVREDALSGDHIMWEEEVDSVLNAAASNQQTRKEKFSDGDIEWDDIKWEQELSEK